VERDGAGSAVFPFAVHDELGFAHLDVITVRDGEIARERQLAGFPLRFVEHARQRGYHP
jgi:hypothetical protein